MAETGRPATAKNEPSTVINLLGGASLGLFLGVLVGLSTTPVVSIVITALVALLAGFFGLSDKSSMSTSAAGAHRLIAFGISATVFTLTGISLRTHETLAPSIEGQKATLQMLGYADKTKEQTEMLRYLRYGLLPAGVTLAKQPLSTGGVLYNDFAPSMCADLSRSQAPADTAQILIEKDNRLRRAADKIKSLAPERQTDAAEIAKLILCPEG